MCFVCCGKLTISHFGGSCFFFYEGHIILAHTLYQDLANYVLSLGDDISENHLKLYAAFKKIKNVITVVAQKKKLVINLPLDIATVTFEEGFSRDVSGLGHWGCGAVELHLQNNADLEKAKALIDRAYNEN